MSAEKRERHDTGDEVLGVDIGGVIMDSREEDEDLSFFGPNFLRAKATRGSVESLRRLGERRFGERIHLVSKCGPDTERRTLLWMEHNSFHDLTGIPRGRVHFVRERREKVPACEEIGVTHFVDDRLEILGYLAEAGVANLYLFRGRKAEVDAYEQYLGSVTSVGGWPELERVLLPDGAGERKP